MQEYQRQDGHATLTLLRAPLWAGASRLLGTQAAGTTLPAMGSANTESTKLEKISDIKTSLWLNTILATRPWHEVPHAFFPWTPPGMVNPLPPWINPSTVYAPFCEEILNVQHKLWQGTLRHLRLCRPTLSLVIWEKVLTLSCLQPPFRQL